jgi:peptidoglycan/LPS O-acetylase OafA/YrhL
MTTLSLAVNVRSLSASRTRDASFDYLRAFIVLLVLLHHSVLAYAIMEPAQSRTFQIVSAPIVDLRRWAGFDILAIFNDAFFMSLMFLLSGLFAWPSLERKGATRFLRDRMMRLGIPFLVATGLLMPVAYYPSYAVTAAEPGFLAYARAWLSLGFWPSGPAWFISVLLLFDTIAAGLYALWRRRAVSAQTPGQSGMHARPAAFVTVLLAVSALVYIPLALSLGPDRWFGFGAFAFQVSRPLLYALYFLAGIWMGAVGTQAGLLAPNAGLARQWPTWLSAGVAAFVLRLVVIIALILPVVRAHQPVSFTLRLLSEVTVVLCCGTISVAFVALFRRFATAHHAVLDSLSTSSYGIYLIHYPIVVWLQFALLSVVLGPIAKGAIVFVGTVALSWGLMVALRRIPAIARVL